MALLKIECRLLPKYCAGRQVDLVLILFLDFWLSAVEVDQQGAKQVYAIIE